MIQVNKDVTGYHIDTEMLMAPFQRAHYETVKWLVNDGPRGTGRTFLLAVAFIEKAMNNPNQGVRIWDHTPGANPGRTILPSVMRLMAEIEKVNEEFVFSFNFSSMTITCKYR